jgi:hypothetical protein
MQQIARIAVDRVPAIANDIEELEISGNKLSSVPLAGVARFRHLRILNLHGLIFNFFSHNFIFVFR